LRYADYDYDNDSELNYMSYMLYMVEKAAVPSAFSLQPSAWFYNLCNLWKSTGFN